VLDTERQYFDQHKTELMAQFRGRFVVIKGEEVIGAYDTMGDALREGARRFGLDSFLARRVEESTPGASFPALTLGLINAKPPHPVRR
jgi:hypothetical protein